MTSTAQSNATLGTENGNCGLETLYPVALLISELKSDDLRVRLEAVKKIPKIAARLGPERTRMEVLPFIYEVLCDEDEVMHALAEQLGNFPELVGGKHHTYTILPLLEKLACNATDFVRNRAVTSLRLLVMFHTQINLEVYYIPMVRKLARGVKVEGRMAACGLLAVCYKRVSTTARSDIRTTFRMLSQDRICSVREAAALKIGEMARVMEAEYLRSFVMPIFVAISRDKEDVIRLLAIPACYKISLVLSHKYKEQLLLSVLREIVHDSSWRVRTELAKKITQIQKGMGNDLSKKGLIPILVILLTDEEPSIRAIAVSKIIQFARHLDRKSQAPFIIKSVLPCLNSLIYDPSREVKRTLASVTNNFCRVVGKTDTMDHLVPIIIEQMNSDCQEARSAIVSRLDIVFDIIGPKNGTSLLLPSIVDRTRDEYWESRFAVIDIMPALGLHLGVDDFGRELTVPCLNLLHDPVFMVRDKSVSNVRTLIQQFGAEWADRAVVPKLVEMASHGSYFRRMTVLFVINKAANLSSAEMVTKQYLPLVLQMATDKVPNVRLNVAKTMKILGPLIEPEALESRLKPALAALQEDPDSDVKFFADESMEELFTGVPEQEGEEE